MMPKRELRHLLNEDQLNLKADKSPIWNHIFLATPNRPNQLAAEFCAGWHLFSACPWSGGRSMDLAFNAINGVNRRSFQTPEAIPTPIPTDIPEVEALSNQNLNRL
ncbi:MAG: hypothetical protein CM15mP49_37930 [Actinomycetota bacterium]|nr:MAG: hypothetical protein CM15mP49_37930 [Actinomycetota bacterium]